MAIHFEDLSVASPGIAQEAAGRLEKVEHSADYMSYLTGTKGLMFCSGRQLTASIRQTPVYKEGLRRQ
jgi:hypothetical protein